MTREEIATRAQAQANRDGIPCYAVCYGGGASGAIWEIRNRLPRGAAFSYMIFEPRLGLEWRAKRAMGKQP